MTQGIENKVVVITVQAAGWARRPLGCSPRRARALCWVRGASAENLRIDFVLEANVGQGA